MTDMCTGYFLWRNGRPSCTPRGSALFMRSTDALRLLTRPAGSITPPSGAAFPIIGVHRRLSQTRCPMELAPLPSDSPSQADKVFGRVDHPALLPCAAPSPFQAAIVFFAFVPLTQLFRLTALASSVCYEAHYGGLVPYGARWCNTVQSASGAPNENFWLH